MRVEGGGSEEGDGERGGTHRYIHTERERGIHRDRGNTPVYTYIQRERERDRDRDRDRDTERDRETERQRERDRERDRERQRQTARQPDRQPHTDTQTETETDRQTERDRQFLDFFDVSSTAQGHLRTREERASKRAS